MEGREPAMCPRSPESQLFPGLNQKKHGQQGKGGDSAPLLCSHETPHGIQTLSVGPTTREGHGAVGAGSGESQDDQRAGASPQSGIG